jgi:hypothetical protein
VDKRTGAAQRNLTEPNDQARFEGEIWACCAMARVLGGWSAIRK